MYLMAALQFLLGPTIRTARLTAAISGWLMIPAQYVLCRCLPLPHPRRTALIAAAVAATTFWPVAQSRYAIEAVLLPPIFALALAAWWRVLTAGADQASGRPIDDDGNAFSPPPAFLGEGPGVGAATAYALLTGALVALALYTHLVGRLLVVVILGSAAWMAWRGRSSRPIALAGLALATAAVLALPQIVHFARHPDALTHRAAIVSIFNPAVEEDPPLQALATNAWRLVGMANLQGDRSWSHNLRGRPVFDPVIGLFFAFGLVLLGRDLLGRRGKPPQAMAVMLALALAATLAPSLFSIGAPNYTRLVGVWPVLFLLPAWGLERAAADRRIAGRGRGPWLIAAVLGTGAAWTAVDYFGMNARDVRAYARNPNVVAAFNGPTVERGDFVADLARSAPAYAMPALWGQSVIRYINVSTGLRSFDPASGLVLPPPRADGSPDEALYLFDPGDAERAAEFERAWPEAVREDALDSNGGLKLTVLRLPGDRQPSSAAVAPEIRFGDRIALAGLEIDTAKISPGSTVVLTLAWRAIAPTDVDHNLFLRLETASGVTIAQFDGPPLDNSYPTDRWRPGERIIQRIVLDIAADAPLGMATLRAGWYDWRNSQRLSVAGDDDAAVDIMTAEIVPDASR